MNVTARFDMVVICGVASNFVICAYVLVKKCLGETGLRKIEASRAVFKILVNFFWVW